MRRFIVLLVVVVLVAGAWSGAWFFAAGELRNAVIGMADADGESAPRVSCGTLGITGFPFRFDIECADATIVVADLTTTLGGLRASLLVYNPTQAVLSALSPATFSDAFTGAQSRLDFSGAEGSARLEAADLWNGMRGQGWRIGRVSVVADDLAWTDTLTASTLLLRASHGEAHLLDMPERHDADAGLAALAAYATLEGAEAPALGIAGGKASIETEISGLPDDLRAFGEDDLLADWQAAGGVVKLVAIRGSAGEEFVESDGALGLDSGSRLDGQIRLRSRGLVERLESMLPEDWKRLIVGAKQEDGSYAQTITIKAGVVFSGLMPITMIPPLL